MKNSIIFRNQYSSLKSKAPFPSLFTPAVMKYHKFTFCSSLLCSKPVNLLVCEDCSVVPISSWEEFCKKTRNISALLQEF